MKGIDTGKDKVKKICDVLKRETLEPAKKEAEQIIQEAHDKSRQIVQSAKEEAAKLIEASKKEIEKDRNVFQSSLNQACKQSLELLKQKIEGQFFHPELGEVLQKPLKDPNVVAELIKAVVQALEKEGIDADLNAIVPRTVSAQAVNQLLLKNILDKLKAKTVELGAIQGGVFVKAEKDNISIDVTESALKELVSDYIRKDFRETLFRS